ncbi:MarR family winged helix-turn-helix transcriptional regulator [Bradyrhizobium sp. SYSU BS000235]|uniref:MarR family winged helix-turn-helix transcriptional regulator n=1 Tax=Bradyrhizobium sp. SYSU BS000235 TaxID=3411332 RepID=UPI003C70F6B4
MKSRHAKARSTTAKKASPTKMSSKEAVVRERVDDPIEMILTQWQRERPDIDPAPMKLFGLLAQSQSMTTSFMNDALEKWGLSRPSFDVLSALRRSGPPFCLTPKSLSESLMLSGAGMTSRLDRLESLYLIARLPEPNDRRSVKIQLTDRGVRLIDEMIPSIVEAQWRVVSALGSRNTGELISLLTNFLSLLASSSEQAAESELAAR